MSELAGLSIPILLSAIAVFVISLAGRLLIGHHKADWNELPEEGDTMEFLRKSGIKPGCYIFPLVHSKEHRTDELKEQRLEAGPWGTIHVWTSQGNLGSRLLQTFTFHLVASFFIAYLGTLAIEPGAGFLKAFQVTGTAGILAYAFGGVPNAIWFSRHVRPAVLDVVDGICFGLITGVVFGLLWP